MITSEQAQKQSRRMKLDCGDVQGSELRIGMRPLVIVRAVWFPVAFCCFGEHPSRG